jgi:subtilisin family serine protease
MPGTRGARRDVPRVCVFLLVLAASLLSALPAAARQEPVLDAALRRLIQPEVREQVAAHGLVRPDSPPALQPFAGAYSLDTDAAGRMRVALFVELPVTGRAALLDQLRAAGAEIGTAAGDVAVVRLPLDRLELLEALPVRRAEAARLLATSHDSSTVATGVHLVRDRTETGWSGMTGAGVLIGIVDSGLDLRHPDFLDDGGATRVAGVWDQVVGTRPPAGFSYGYYCSRSAVQELVATGDLAACPSTDNVGHGTHVAGSAAGSGAAGPEPFRYAGMAPEAELLIVRAGNNTFTEDRVVDGVAWIRQQAQALGRPAVVNLSLGHQYGPHDGSLLFERMLDALAGPGLVIVAAAGNEGVNRNAPTPPATPRLVHARAFTTPGQPASVQFVVSPYTPAANLCTGNFIDLSAWYATGDLVEITVVRPDGSQHTGVPGTTSLSDHPGGRIQISNAVQTQAATAEGAIQISGCGTSGPPAPGSWTVVFRAAATAGGSAPVDLYINNVRLGAGGTATGAAGFDNRFVVAAPASARRVIAVGAFTTRTCWPSRTGAEVCYTAPSQVGDLAPFSSGGPTRDGRIKPEVAAPGAAIVSALSRQASAPPARVVPGEQHWALEGTSMASPHVAGAVALMLQQLATLTPEDVREILMRSSRQDPFTQRVYDPAPDARPSDWWGFGKLDVPAALTELLVPGLVATLTISPAADTIPAGGTRQLRAVARDEDGATVFALVEWASLDPGVALVNARGLVTGVVPGTARVVARANGAADTALVVVRPPAVLTIRGRAVAPGQAVQAPAGTLLPLLALALTAEGPEAVQLRSLAVQLTGADPDATLVLLDDPDGDGVIGEAPRVLASRDILLAGPATVVILPTDTVTVPRNTTRHVILALAASGRAATGTRFTASLLRAGTTTLNVNTRLPDRFELAGDLLAGPAETTVLRPGELFALSQNPVRTDGVRLNFAARPTQAMIFTPTGARVADLLPRFDGLHLLWDLTNDGGRRIVPGVYYLVARVDGELVRETIIVISPVLGGGG